MSVASLRRESEPTSLLEAYPKSPSGPRLMAIAPLPRPPAFEPMFEQLNRKIIFYFRKRGFSFQESEDLAQVVFVRAHSGLGAFRRESSLETWVFSLAKNVWRNECRSFRTQKRSGATVPVEAFETAQGNATEQPRDQAPSALDSILRHEQHLAILKGVQALPPKMRKCLCLHVYDDRPYHRIAEDLDVSLNTVKSTISQAKKKLRSTLRNTCPELF